jgi:DNA-binding transcriptional regulator YbjK
MLSVRRFAQFLIDTTNIEQRGLGPKAGSSPGSAFASKPGVSGRYTAGIPKRRKPNPDQRRRELCDTAIQLLADDGAKGLSHLKVDGRAGVPDGTTSFYFRTRSALLHAVAERMVELDLAALQTVADTAAVEAGAASTLAKVVIQSGEDPQLSRTRARYELTIQATRDPVIAETLQRAVDAFTKLHHDILVQLLPHGADLDPDVVDDLTNVTLTFINGLMLRFVHGDRIIDTPEQLDGVLSAIVAGVLASEQQGRLTHDGATPRPPAK